MDPNLAGFVLTFALVVYSIVLHELAHGYAALRFGDPTAARLGRLTLNPLSHVDPLGTVIFPILQLAVPPHRIYIGWAKPVPVATHNLRPRVGGEIVVALAGIIVNLSIALALSLLMRFPALVPPDSQLQRAVWFTLASNVGLAVFNLVPIPPLDGSHVLKHLLPPGMREPYERLGFQGIVVILLLNMMGWLDPVIGPPIFGILRFLIEHVIGRVPEVLR